MDLHFLKNSDKGLKGQRQRQDSILRGDDQICVNAFYVDVPLKRCYCRYCAPKQSIVNGEKERYRPRKYPFGVCFSSVR